MLSSSIRTIAAVAWKRSKISACSYCVKLEFQPNEDRGIHAKGVGLSHRCHAVLKFRISHECNKSHKSLESFGTNLNLHQTS